MARKQKRIFALDAETDPFKYGRVPAPFVWGLYDGETYIQFWGDDCTEQLIDYIKDETDCIFYAHNGGKFDWFFLLPYLDPDLFMINGRIAKATLFDGQIELRDSWLILPLPLKANDKGDIDYALMERDKRDQHKNEISRYLQRDCQSLWEWVNNFREQFGGRLTLASSAFAQLKKTNYPVELTYETFDAQFRHFYFGGRVQCFDVGAFDGPLKYVDINSAYPYAMTHRHWQGSQIIEHLKMPDPDKKGSWFAEIKAKSFGALPFRHEGKLYFPDDGITRRYFASGWEINAGLETGTLKIEKVIAVYKPLFTHDFSEYVDKFFAMKLEAERAGNKTLRQFAKLMLNSCYGKFGQDGRDFKKFRLCDFGEIPTDHPDWTIHAETDFLKTIFERPDPVDRFYNVATAASITAFVRAYLWKNIHASDGVLYCDTDSIICRNFSGPISDRLGEWNLEANIAKAYIAQRKMYAISTDTGEHKTASKGVHLSFDQIKQGVETGIDIISEKDAPAFSLQYGVRFFARKTDFKNIAKNACNNPGAN